MRNLENKDRIPQIKGDGVTKKDITKVFSKERYGVRRINKGEKGNGITRHIRVEAGKTLGRTDKKGT